MNNYSWLFLGTVFMLGMLVGMTLQGNIIFHKTENNYIVPENNTGIAGIVIPNDCSLMCDSVKLKGKIIK